MAIINGWGRGTWGQLTWGEPIPVTLSAPSAATSALGTVSVVAKAKVLPSGLSATSTNGGVAVDAGGVIGVNGFAGVSAVGTPTTVSTNNISVSGLAATSALGAPGVNGQAVASVAGLTSTLGSVSVDVDGEANVAVTGVAGTSAIGTATTITDNRFNVGELVNQMVTNDPFVNPTVNAACNFTITGVSATGELGHTFKWQDIDESQTPNWTDVAA